MRFLALLFVRKDVRFVFPTFFLKGGFPTAFHGVMHGVSRRTVAILALIFFTEWFTIFLRFEMLIEITFMYKNVDLRQIDVKSD